MVTGDNWTTARAIAAKLGITDVSAEVIHRLLYLPAPARLVQLAWQDPCIEGSAVGADIKWQSHRAHRSCAPNRATLRCCLRARQST